MFNATDPECDCVFVWMMAGVSMCGCSVLLLCCARLYLATGCESNIDKCQGVISIRTRYFLFQTWHTRHIPPWQPLPPLPRTGPSRSCLQQWAGGNKTLILHRGEVISQASNCCSSRVDICVQIFFIGKHIYNMQFCILLQLNISLFKHFVWNTTFNFQHSKLQQSDIRNAVNLTITFE